MEPLRRAWNISDEVACGLLLVLAPACAILLLALPRPIGPVGLPSLRLDAKQVAEVLKRDQEREKGRLSAPAAELQALFFERGLAERALSEPTYAYVQRIDKVRRALANLRRTEGENALLALRARAVHELELALNLVLSKERAEQVLGSFPTFLHTYHAAQAGVLLAPHFVVRTLYKGRWNFIHELPPVDDFTPVERIAYYGWLALHADGAPLALRQRALDQYQAAGGSRVAEAKGVLFFSERQYDKAAYFLQQAYQQHATLRLRNYLLGAQRASAR